MTAVEPASPGSAARRRLRWAGRWAFFFAAVALAWPWGEGAWTPVILPASSPFVAACSILATRSIGFLALLGIPILLLALISHRWFCRHGCPAGLLQDIAGRLRRDTPRRPPRATSIGTWILAITAGGAFLGLPLFLWMDSLALFQGFLNGWRRPLTAAGLLGASGLPLLLLLQVIRPRLWCRCICPLGALQELLGRARPLFGRMRWIRPGLPPGSSAHGGRGMMGRRLFLGGSAGAAAAGVLRLARCGAEDAPLRPPGAIDEGRFEAACIRCGNCRSACPSRIIEADLGASGLPGLLTPRLRFEEDYCREDCDRCGRVCPSGAIARLSLEEKGRRAIGSAEVDVRACLLANGRECTACIRQCPYGAIALRSTGDGFSNEPRVDPGRCTGCGACEAVCPVRPIRAIRVATRPGVLPLPLRPGTGPSVPAPMETR